MKSQQRGFTLMEIMVVVLLIGITMAMASVRINRDFDRVALKEAERFVALLEHIREESVLTGRLHGVEVDETSKTYRFMIEANGWQEVTNNQVLRARVIPDPLTIRSDLNYKPSKKKGLGSSSALINKKLSKQKKKNLMLVTPVGDITPFEVVISGDSMDYRIALDDNSEPTIVEKDPDQL